jgi:phosphoribosylformylglycinamidine cyclo-ligase
MNYDDARIYASYGASASKTDVKKAIANLDPGLFPTAFCKILPDIAGDPKFCSVIHSDSAGTKASLAYMYFKETGNLSIFRGIVRDAMVMNIDDLACVGAVDSLLLNDTLNRNKLLIPGEVVAIVIDEFDKFSKKLTQMGVAVSFGGGETADVGDLIRTIDVICTVTARLPRKKVVTNNRIQVGDLIVGLASSGQAAYEEVFNSGIGSNGLTLARHGTLHPDYRSKYPEAYDPAIRETAFSGKYHLTDTDPDLPIDIGTALLSPTRPYAPIIREILARNFEGVHGLVHCTGGGQTKCLNAGKGINYVKDALFPVPRIFKVIQASSNADWREMYQVFNMGHRMEIICPPGTAAQFIDISQKYHIDAKIIGKCEKSPDSTNHVTIITEGQKFTFP